MHIQGIGSRKFLACGTALAAIWAAAPSKVFAQITNSVEDTEIIVTAQRRQENLQAVPIAVSAMNTEFLKEHEVRSLQDLSGAVPGLVTTNSVGGGLAPLSIRGVGGVNGGANTFNDEPVAVYLDGVYIGRLSFSTSDLLDVESIQVLRGPQGTLFGRNATAGAVLVTSAAPTKTAEAMVQGSVTDLHEHKISAMASGPLISDMLLARVAFGYSKGKGYTRNTATGGRLNGSEATSVRGRLRAMPNDQLTLDAIVDYQTQDTTYGGIQVANIAVSPTSPFAVRPGFQDLIESDGFGLDSPVLSKQDALTLTFTGNYDFGSAQLDSISSYREFKASGDQDSDGTPAHALENRINSKNSQYTQEIRLSSDAKRRLSWILGAYYIHERNAVNPLEIRNYVGLFGLGLNPKFVSGQKLDSWAAFADATFNVSDRLSVTGGLRYTYEKKNFHVRSQNLILNGGTIPNIPAAGPLAGVTLPAGTPFPPGSPAFTSFADKATFKNVTPRFVVNYRPTDDMMVYASFSKGFKSGGFNAFGLSPAFEPEKITAYEAGLKSEWLDGRVRANVAAFFYDYSNLQVRIGVPTGGLDIQNAAQAEVKGGEFELTIRPVNALRLAANLAYLDGKFTKGTLPAIPLAARFPYGAPVSLAPQDVSGNLMSRAPEWQMYLAADYDLDLNSLGKLKLHADWRHQTKVFFLEVNQSSTAFQGKAWSSLGASATLSFGDGNYDIMVFGRNLTDGRYVTQVTQYGSFPVAAISEPRKYGIQLTARF